MKITTLRCLTMFVVALTALTASAEEPKGEELAQVKEELTREGPILRSTELKGRFDDALTTDRPDTAESSTTVGKLRFQMETGFTFDHDRSAGVTTRNFSAPTLFRVGIIDPLEFRVEGAMVNVRTETGTERLQGFSDLDFGFKAHVQDQRGWGPSLGFLAHLTTPTGKDEFSSNTYEPTFKLLMDWELPAEFSLGTNFGGDLPARDAAGDRFARALYAVALGHPIPGLRERMRAFIETAGIVPTVGGKDQEHTFDSGLSFLITGNLQLDSFVQVGLTEATPDFAVGAGMSFRI